jgi:small redox-active disulfide protein 2
MMEVKILGTGCPACRSMYNEVTRIAARNGWEIDVEYVQDIERILSYRVMGLPALVVDEKVVLVGNRGPGKIEEKLKECL